MKINKNILTCIKIYKHILKYISFDQMLLYFWFLCRFVHLSPARFWVNEDTAGLNFESLWVQFCNQSKLIVKDE